MEHIEPAFETEVLTRLAVIESKLDSYKEVKAIAYEADTRSKNNEQEIKEIKDNNKWLKRTVIAESIGIIFMIIGAFIKIGIGVV